MIKLNYLSVLFCAMLIFISCSEEAIEEEMSSVIFDGVEVTKSYAFIDDPVIVLTINGSGFSEAEVSTAKNITIKKAAYNVYELSATEAVLGRIFITLIDKNGDIVKNTKTIDIGFYEHGVKNDNTVEGIKVNLDEKDKVIELLGEPEFSSETEVNETLTLEYLKYTSKGLLFIVDKSTKIIETISIYSSNYYVTDNLIKNYYTSYPYDLPYGWRINQTTMNTVIEELGDPNFKSSSDGSTLRSYRFDVLRSWVRFFSDEENDTFGKVIKSMSIY